MPHPGRPYSVATASKKSGIPKRTLQDAITRKALKATKLSDAATSAYLIDPQDLDDYLNRNGQKAADA
jgi:hypothetical protein